MYSDHNVLKMNVKGKRIVQEQIWRKLFEQE
jgi:hypothetical protein